MGSKSKRELPMPAELRRRIFALRCKSKGGPGLTSEELRECTAAYNKYPKQYSDMDPEVFEATRPFGSIR